MLFEEQYMAKRHNLLPIACLTRRPTRMWKQMAGYVDTKLNGARVLLFGIC
jgi:hypothetical protein